MALLDFLKKKEDIKKSQPVEKKTEDASVAPKTREQKDWIIQGGHVSEKATNGAQLNQYTFKVYKGVNKPQIAKAIEGMYKVDVLAVNMIKIPKKKRRLGGIQGWKKGYRKAIVTVKEGQKIEVI